MSIRYFKYAHVCFLIFFKVFLIVFKASIKVHIPHKWAHGNLNKITILCSKKEPSFLHLFGIIAFSSSA